jgi:hypothetical protein
MRWGRDKGDGIALDAFRHPSAWQARSVWGKTTQHSKPHLVDHLANITLLSRLQMLAVCALHHCITANTPISQRCISNSNRQGPTPASP